MLVLWSRQGSTHLEIKFQKVQVLALLFIFSVILG